MQRPIAAPPALPSRCFGEPEPVAVATLQENLKMATKVRQLERTVVDPRVAGSGLPWLFLLRGFQEWDVNFKLPIVSFEVFPRHTPKVANPRC